MRHRTKKQIIIAIIFFGFWTGVFGLIYWATYTPPPPPAPTPRIAQSIQVVSSQIISVTSGKGDLVGLIRNPNSDAGAADVKFEFKVVADGQVVSTLPGETFVLPSQQKYVALFNQNIPSGATVSLNVTSPEWTFVDATFSQPSFVLINQTSNIISGDPDIYNYKGVLANQSDLDYYKVEVTAVGFDSQGQLIGVGKTFMGSLKSQERREFTAQWPLQKGDQVARVQTFPDINLFLSDAVEKREGEENLVDVPQYSPRSS